MLSYVKSCYVMLSYAKSCYVMLCYIMVNLYKQLMFCTLIQEYPNRPTYFMNIYQLLIQLSFIMEMIKKLMCR